MSAETGVGPAIASPSQDCSGNCADLPQAPSSSIRPIAVSAPSLAPAGTGEHAGEAHACRTATNMIMMAIDSPKSPTRFTTKAFFAAAAYAGT